MNEVCFCGRVGELADRTPTYLGDGDWGLTCPDCGHLDRLTMWPIETREELVAEARRRRETPVILDRAHTFEVRRTW